MNLGYNSLQLPSTFNKKSHTETRWSVSTWLVPTIVHQVDMYSLDIFSRYIFAYAFVMFDEARPSTLSTPLYYSSNFIIMLEMYVHKKLIYFVRREAVKERERERERVWKTAEKTRE